MKIRFRSDGRSECDGSWHGGTSKWTELALQVSCWISDWNTFKWNSIAFVFDVRLQRQVESLEIRYKINKSLEFATNVPERVLYLCVKGSCRNSNWNTRKINFILGNLLKNESIQFVYNRRIIGIRWNLNELNVNMYWMCVQRLVTTF